jgi:PAS domain-containing protein
MQNAAGNGVALAAHDQNATYRAVISDLVSLVEHVQKSLRLIEQAIARETSPEMTPGGPESSTNIIVLDDISQRYMKADAAPQACDVASRCAPCSIPAIAIPVPQTVFLRRKFRFSRAVNRLLRSLRGVRHATGAPPSPNAATTMEKLDAALNNMSHGLCMFGPDNRLLPWNDRYVKMHRLAPDCLRVGW